MDRFEMRNDSIFIDKMLKSAPKTLVLTKRAVFSIKSMVGTGFAYRRAR
ncbi:MULTISPECIES: hypothetical protein [unclassified Fibrobacter]|nr:MULTISPECIES: hypothetical protein [unclassified Fibrobacter]